MLEPFVVVCGAKLGLASCGGAWTIADRFLAVEGVVEEPSK